MPRNERYGALLLLGHVPGESRDQESLFPASLDELGFTKARAKTTGRPPCDPAALLALYLYGYLNPEPCAFVSTPGA